MKQRLQVGNKVRVSWDESEEGNLLGQVGRIRKAIEHEYGTWFEVDFLNGTITELPANNLTLAGVSNLMPHLSLMSKEGQLILLGNGTTELSGLAFEDAENAQEWLSEIIRQMHDLEIAEHDEYGYWNKDQPGMYLVLDTQHAGSSFILRITREICSYCGALECSRGVLYSWAGTAFGITNYEGTSIKPIKHFWTVCSTCGNAHGS